MLLEAKVIPTPSRQYLRVDLLFLEELKGFLGTVLGESHQEYPEQFVDDVDAYSDHLCMLSERQMTAMKTFFVWVVSCDEELYAITRDSGEVEVGFSNKMVVTI